MRIESAAAPPKPHSLAAINLKPPALVDAYTRRHGAYRKGDVLPETIVPHSPRRRVADFRPGFLKQNHIEGMERNQLLNLCCRHPENHEVEGFKSHPDEPAGDIYIYYCQCGRKHRYLCVGVDDRRPEWR